MDALRDAALFRKYGSINKSKRSCKYYIFPNANASLQCFQRLPDRLRNYRHRARRCFLGPGVPKVVIPLSVIYRRYAQPSWDAFD